METNSLKSGLPYRGDVRHMKTHGSAVYALFSKKYSSFFMYERIQGENFVSYQASSKVCVKEKVKKFIAGLREWLNDNQLDSDLISGFVGLFLDIEIGVYCVEGWNWVFAMETNSMKSRNAERVRKRSVDHQGSVEGSRKGKSGVGNDDVMNTKRRKGNKFVDLSIVGHIASKSRNSVEDGVASVSIQSDGPELGQNRARSKGLTGYLLDLGGSGNAIPRKRRGSVGSKSHVAKQFWPSGSIDQTNKMKYDFKDGGVDIRSVPQHAKKKRKQLIIDEESSVDPTANLNSDWKDPTVAVLNVPQQDKETTEQLNINKGDLVDQTAVLENRMTAIRSTSQRARKRREKFNNDEINVSNASSRKGQGHCNKRKGLPLDSLEFTKKVQPAVGYSKGIPENFMDDEVQHVKNAAMILSSGFDPSRTRVSSSHSGGDTGNRTENLQASSDCPSPENASRILSQRYDYKEKGSPRKRRRFYEVKYMGQNARCVLNERIKVFQPFDERWYNGLVTDYDEERKLHLVKYDEKDKEWISLQNERFMLLLLRSEVTDVEKSLQSCTEDKITDETKKDLTMSQTDKEAVKALLALPSSAATSGVETQITHLPPISDSQPLSRNIKNALRISDVCLLEKETSGLCFSDSAEGLADEANGGELMLKHATRPEETRLPIVFYRKHFPKKKGVSVADRFSISYKQDGIFDCVKPVKLMLSVGYDVMFKEFLTRLSLPVCSILEFTLGSYTSRFSSLSLLLQYGATVIRWPRVYFEMIFVDNKGGLWSFLLEGCLQLVLALLFVLAVFCEANEQSAFVGLEIPVSLVGFKLSCAQDRSKQHVFSFYSFSKLKNGLFKEVARRKSLRDIIPNGLSRYGKENRKQHPNYYVKHGMLPFTLCFGAAPFFFRSLHFKLLLQSSISCVRLRQHCCLIPDIDLDKTYVNGINSLVCDGERTNVVYSGFGNGPRKPRTQVHYATPSGSSKFRSRYKPLRHNGHPFWKLRRASKKRTYDDSKGYQRNLEQLACKSNVLITIADRCRRESGARVAVELADQNEWRLSVKFSGGTKYSHKVDHVFQRGSTNRYTHAITWKGGKDWALEFPDRSQWILFKKMHKECYNRNSCAASVKNIPIPGVRLVEKCEDNTEKLPFTRSPGYLRNIENDIDMAMNPLKILYDMDSEDEQWILRNEKSFQTQETSCRAITDDLFQKTMDKLEKFAYAHQRDHFTVAEIEKFMVGVEPSEVIDSIYQHWQQKRKRVGRPLIRHLQPPAWKRYQRNMQEWNQLVTQVNNTAACGGNTKAPPVEKPAMFAFCLKPHGLEVLSKGFKHRSQKKFHIAGHRHALIGDQDERRSNSSTFRDEKATFREGNHPKRFKNQSKEISVQFVEQNADELRLRKISCAATNAYMVASLKRANAQRAFAKAEFAIHVARSALMTATAVKAASCSSV